MGFWYEYKSRCLCKLLAGPNSAPKRFCAVVCAGGVIERLLRVKDAENCEVLWAELRSGSWSVLRRLRPTLDGYA